LDIRAVDLNLLKAFDALNRERAVTRAASRIGLSQPAMSHALSRLRSLFANDLFIRTQAGMEPTAHAREIAPLVSAAIEHIEAALNLGVGFNPAKSNAIFTAGMAEYAEIALVGHLAAALAERAPQATLRLLPLNGFDAVEQLDRGTIDVAIAHLRVSPAAIESRTLFRDPFVVVLRKGHPLLAEPFSIEAYAAQRHILVSPRGQTTGAIDRVLVDFGLRRRVALLVATYLALPAALAASDLIATVPCRAAEQIATVPDIGITPLPLDLAMTVSMAWHRRAASEPAQNWFRALLIEAAGSEAR